MRQRVRPPSDGATFPLNQTNALKQNPALLTPLDSDAVGQKRLNWIRGESANETTAGGLRKRTKTQLGAIVNSTPWFIGAPAAGYSNVEFGTGYGAFRTNTVNAARNSVAVGANDGMLHIFDASTGVEQFAYLPRAMYDTTTTAPYSKLSALTAKDFLLTSGTDRLTVDGSVMAADMNLSTTSTPNWRTYLFGSFGRGAQGVYALDVTSPQTITSETTVNAVCSRQVGVHEQSRLRFRLRYRTYQREKQWATLANWLHGQWKMGGHLWQWLQQCQRQSSPFRHIC